MKTYLREHWSDQFGYEKAKSELVFVGRDREVKSLKHALLNNTSSTVLVSSVRGVGKTTFVHKVLGEIRADIIPIFVNVGHSLKIDANGKEGSSGKNFLTSLIRAAYLTDEFKDDKDLERLYYQSIGTYEKGEEVTRDSTSNTDLGVEVESKDSLGDTLRQGVSLAGVALATLGISIDNIWIKALGVLGLVSLPFSLRINAKFAKTIADALRSKDSYKLDNAAAYLETRFEQWLESQSGKTKKTLIFVVDELDRDNEESFNAIKEYKNLFARSFAHFIFISNQEAYAFTQQNRSESKYPTLFTHVYYLPIPSREEMEAYLQSIFMDKEDTEEDNELEHYLLFRASNDFFSLKNLINDLSEFDSDGRQYMDTDTLKQADRNYLAASNVYLYIDCFYKYYARTPKLYWLSNSKLQEEVFKFAQANLNKNFTINHSESEHISKLTLLLYRTGVLSAVELNPAEDAVHSEETPLSKYGWTGQFRNIDSLDQLFPEDEKFIAAMRRLIRIANDIDDLPKAHKDDAFNDDYDDVIEGMDGSPLTGVNLYSIYEKNKDLYKKLLSPEERLYSRAESAKDATEEIDVAIKNALSKQQQILFGALDKATDEQGNIMKTTIEKGVALQFEIESWRTSFSERNTRLFFTSDPAKQVLFVIGVTDFSTPAREAALAELRSRKNIQVINLYDAGKEVPQHPTVQKDAAGRKRRQRVAVENLTSFPIPVDDVRDLVHPLKLAIKHLTST